MSKITPLQLSEECWKLRVKGFSYRQIGNKFGVSIGRAKTLVENYFSKEYSQEIDNPKMLQALELDRLDYALKIIWMYLEKGDSIQRSRAVKDMLAITHLRAQLLKLLDVPEESPQKTAQQIHTFVSSLMEATNG